MSEHWTEGDIPDLTGRTVLITGANSGIGLEAARAAAEHGATVVLGCRNHVKAEAAVATIRTTAPDAQLEILDLDLADLGSVETAAGKFLANHDRIDVLVNNAGVMALPKQSTAQGFEMQFGVNHVAHFALTGRLLERLLATPRSRVVSISSMGHRPGSINFDDLQSEHNYGPWTAYFQSKLANLLFTYELQRKLTAAGVTTIAVAAHPGGSSTNLGNENPGGVVNTIAMKAKPLIDMVMQSAAMGALPTLRAATDPAVKGGEYYGPDGLMEQRGYPKRVQSSRRSQDIEVAKRLWRVSTELTGVTYSELV